MRLNKIDYDPAKDYEKYDYQEICAYVNEKALPVNVYLPRTENEYSKSAVVCIHGGAWQSDLKKGKEWQGSWMKHNASILADFGFYAIEITHESITEASISKIIDDVKFAFEYINKVVRARHGIKNLYVIGDSAGGHLALMSAFFPDIEVKKVVACNPVSDLTDPKWQLGTTTPEERRNASPIFMKDKTDAQIYLLHGDADRTVPLECSVKLHAHLTEQGIKSELEILEGAAHAFILHGYKTPKDLVNEYMEKVIDIFTS